MEHDACRAGPRKIAAVKQELGTKYYPELVVFAAADISQAILKQFKTVNSLVSNAGIVIHGELHETTEENWDRVFAIDVNGTYLTSKAFLSTMIAQNHGSIVNNSSASGLSGDRAIVA